MHVYKNNTIILNLEFYMLILQFNTLPLKTCLGTSLVVQWVRLHAPNAGGLGLIPGGETRSRMLLQLRVLMPQLEKDTLHSATNTWSSQNK